MTVTSTPPSDVEQLQQLAAAATRLRAQVARRIVGQEEAVEGILAAILAGGHALLIGVPGLAKTMMVHTVSEALALSFQRVQFTPDLMPSDITGTEIIEEDLTTGKRAFRFVKGPVFANVVLADEINRTPPKTQAALLQAMQEHQVTVGGQTYSLPEPFFVLATQNPIEQEGTYPLPEAQVDRFLLKAKVDYPTREEERQILDRMISGEAPAVARVLSGDAVRALTRRVREIYMDDRLRDYIVALVSATRNPRGVGLVDLAPLIGYGASPRATLAFSEASRAVAFLRGRGYVVPEDVKEIARDVLRHRVLLTYEAEAEEVTSDTVVDRILERVEVP
jgi:MoxR-like ATPase